MNDAHLHLALNHAPLFTLIFGFCLLMYSLRQKSDQVHRIALYTFIIAAIMSIATYITGGRAEEVVNHLQGINLEAIEDHEGNAKIANIITILTGLSSIAWFFVKNKKIKTNLSLALICLSLLGVAYMARTANIGGLIRHSELDSHIITINKLEKIERN